MFITSYVVTTPIQPNYQITKHTYRNTCTIRNLPQKLDTKRHIIKNEDDNSIRVRFTISVLLAYYPDIFKNNNSNKLIFEQEHSESADPSAKGAHILKISSKSVNNFLSYLSLKITFHGSRRSR